MKRSTVIVLLALGLLLTGGGIWLWPSVAPTNSNTNIPTPPGSPVIVMDVSHIMAGERSNLSIYEDGTVIFIEEQGLRMPSPGHPATRTWNTGQLGEEELNELLEYIRSSGFDILGSNYSFPGRPIEGGPLGGITTGDMSLTISIDHEDLSKTVTAAHYLAPDEGLSYPDMPDPLNDIYQRLMGIAVITVEVAHETIS